MSTRRGVALALLLLLNLALTLCLSVLLAPAPPPQRRDHARKPTPSSAPEDDAATRLLKAEDDFIEYWRASPAEREALHAPLKQAAEEMAKVQNDYPYCHYRYYVAWVQRALGHSGAVDVSAGREAAVNAFLFERENPVKALRLLRRLRTPSRFRRTIDGAYEHIAGGLSSDERGQAICAELLRHIAPEWMRGKTVADIGAGRCTAEPPLVELVGPRGKVIAVEVDPSMLRYYKTARDFIPELRQVEFRLTSFTRPALARAEVDLVILDDLHILGIDPHDRDGEKRFREQQLPWLRRVRAALKPGGVVYIEEGPNRRPVQEVAPWVRRAGFQVRAFGLGGGRGDSRGVPGFVLLATPEERASPE